MLIYNLREDSKSLGVFRLDLNIKFKVSINLHLQLVKCLLIDVAMVRFSLGLLFVLLSVQDTGAQVEMPTKASYELKFLKAKYSDDGDIILLFHYSTEKESDFKLIISGKLTYCIGEECLERTAILGESGNHHSIHVFGEDMKSKDELLYNLIKDSVDFSSKKPFSIIVFYLRDIIYQYVDRMTFTYGLWEPIVLQDPKKKIRFEKRYFISIER